MDRAGPRGRTALLYGSHGGDPHRIGLLRLERSNSRHENSIIADRAGEAGNSLLTGRNAGLPQCSERLTSLSAEAKSSSAPVRLALGQEGFRYGEEKCDQYRERGNSTAPRGPSISQMTSWEL
jgi:hypothetical protein